MFKWCSLLRERRGHYADADNSSLFLDHVELLAIFILPSRRTEFVWLKRVFATCALTVVVQRQLARGDCSCAWA